MTFMVALREARRWKRLRPLWSPQQWGRRSSFVGLTNLGINPCVPRACCCWDLCYHFCFCLSLSLPNFILGFGLDLRFEGISASREWPNIFTKPLGSGVVRLFIRKVKFGTAFVVHVGIGTSDVVPKLLTTSGVPTQTVVTSDSCWQMTLNFMWNFLDKPIHVPL